MFACKNKKDASDGPFKKMKSKRCCYILQTFTTLDCPRQTKLRLQKRFNGKLHFAQKFGGQHFRSDHFKAQLD